MAFLLPENNKLAIKSPRVKCLFSGPGGLYAYISRGQPSWAHLVFERTGEPTSPSLLEYRW